MSLRKEKENIKGWEGLLFLHQAGNGEKGEGASGNSQRRKEGTFKAMVAGDCRSQKVSRALDSVTLHLLQ